MRRLEGRLKVPVHYGINGILIGELEAGRVHIEPRNRKDVCMSAFHLSNCVTVGGDSLYIEAKPVMSQIERKPHHSFIALPILFPCGKDESGVLMTIRTNI